MIFYLNPFNWIATLFFVGKIKHLGSVIASVIAVPLAFGVMHFGGWNLLLAATVGLFFLGLFATMIYIKSAGTEEEVVVDEVVGVWTALLLAQLFGYPLVFVVYAMTLASFIIFDIWKPWPINTVHDHFHGSLGIMLDDLIAGFYGFAGMAIALFFYVKLGWGG